MKIKWLITFIAIFLLSICLICTDRNEVARGQEIHPEVTDAPALPIFRENTSSVKSATPAGQTITQGTDVQTDITETVYITEGSENADTNAASELPPANLETDESAPGYQPDSNQELNDSLDGQVEYRYIIHYVDKEVVKEVLVEKPVTLRQFASLGELKAWLAMDDTNEYVHLFAGKDGVCQTSDRYDCDDYAFELQQRAANSGFLISVTIIQQHGKPHMINLACIDNNIYYIEPQSDEVWFYCTRD
jgi:hypothetical protein